MLISNRGSLAYFFSMRTQSSADPRISPCRGFSPNRQKFQPGVWSRRQDGQPFDDICQCSVLETYEAERRRLDPGDRCEAHADMFILGKGRISRRLWLQDISPPVAAISSLDLSDESRSETFSWNQRSTSCQPFARPRRTGRRARSPPQGARLCRRAVRCRLHDIYGALVSPKQIRQAVIADLLQIVQARFQRPRYNRNTWRAIARKRRLWRF